MSREASRELTAAGLVLLPAAGEGLDVGAAMRGLGRD